MKHKCNGRLSSAKETYTDELGQVDYDEMYADIEAAEEARWQYECDEALREMSIDDKSNR